MSTLIRRSVLAALGLLSTIALAADPESGKVDDASYTATWTGSFLTPNPSSDVDKICEEGTPTCDVYHFEVAVTDPNVDDDFITITAEWPTAEMDIDLFVYDEAGNEVGSGTAFQGGYDMAMIPAVNGKYRVEVVPYLAAAEDYTGTVTYVKYEEEKSLLGFAGALPPAALGGLALLALAGLARRRPE